jgi:hypothetical protein
MVTFYKDPDTHQEKLFILMSLPGGSSYVELSLVGFFGSSTTNIIHSWPLVMYDIDSLFAKVTIRNENLRVSPQNNCIEKCIGKQP